MDTPLGGKPSHSIGLFILVISFKSRIKPKARVKNK
jgi:hypothetical protein